jgi:hypothetical protein
MSYCVALRGSFATAVVLFATSPPASYAILPLVCGLFAILSLTQASCKLL